MNNFSIRFHLWLIIAFMTGGPLLHAAEPAGAVKITLMK